MQIIEQDGWREERWVEDGKLHRLDGPARITYRRGTIIKEWYKRGEAHRIGGPAYERWRDGVLVKEKWYEYDVLHRRGGPAYLCTDGCYLEEWRVRGKKHRRDGPAFIWSRRHDYEEGYYRHDKRHRVGDPCAIHTTDGRITYHAYAYKGRYELEEHFYDTGAMRKTINYTNGRISHIVEYSRDGVQLFVCTKTRLFRYYNNGRLREEAWRYKNKFHRTNKPARILYSDTGEVLSIEYYRHDKFHRIGGPAIDDCWHQRGLLHRIGGPANNGDYYNSGNLHRSDGPARGRFHYVRGIYYTPEEYELLQRPPQYVATINILPQPIAEATLYHFNNISDAANIRQTAFAIRTEKLIGARRRRAQLAQAAQPRPAE